MLGTHNSQNVVVGWGVISSCYIRSGVLVPWMNVNFFQTDLFKAVSVALC